MFVISVIPSEAPKIEGAVSPTHAQGDTVNLNCTSAPSLPAAKMEWTINDAPVIIQLYLKVFV